MTPSMLVRPQHPDPTPWEKRAVLTGLCPDLRDLVREVLADGWSVARTNGGHIRFTCIRTGAVAFGSGTPRSGRRAIENVRAQMKRARRMKEAVA